MVFKIFLAIAVLGVALFFLHYYFEKKETGRWRIPRQSLFALSLFCTCVLYLPWVIYSWDPGTGSLGKFLLSIPYMFVRLMQTVSLDADYETAIEIVTLAEKTGASLLFLQIYSGILFWVSALVPAFGIWTVMGLFRNKIGYWYESSRYSFKKTFYIFNGAGKKNVDLAESIWESLEEKERRSSSFLFCNVEEELAEEELETILGIKGLYTQDSPASLMKIIKYYSVSYLRWLYKFFGPKNIRYFLLEDEDRNFDDAIGILKAAEKADRERAERVKIDILLHDNELDNILDAQEKYGIFVRILDAERLYAQELYARWPLFSGLGDGDKEIDLVILGKGSVAEELLLNAVWMGTIGSAGLKITYIGQDAAWLERKLKMSCPGLFDQSLAGGEDLKPAFVNIGNSDNPQFNTMEITKANYVIIAGENDETNIRLAMWYKTWVARRMPVRKRSPFMAVLVKDAEKAEQARRLKVQESQEPYDFHIFGTDKEIFSARNLLHSKLLESLYRVQLSYNCNDMGRKPTAEEEANTWNQLNESVYNFRSSEASALYIVNRLYDSGALEEQLKKELRSGKSDPQEISGSDLAEYWYKALYSNEVGSGSGKLNELIEAYNRLLRDTKMLEKLAQTEHHRWNAYMVSNGWITMSDAETREWMEMRGSKEHKDYLRLRHACIVTWEELNTVSETKGRDPEYFKNADRTIVAGVTDFIVRDK
ncbi:MAG: hypothetical protein IJ198_05275 [Lachnospiraceae bacterium]|nr:hypothetical protein [Lachnospiraceae bacterium]